MFIHITKELQPILVPLVFAIKTNEEYKISDYNYDELILEAPNADIELQTIIDIARIGTIVEDYPIWFEIPNVNLNDDISSGVTFSSFLDISGNTIIRQWNDISLHLTGTSNTILFYQPSNNTDFVYNDVEIIQEDGFTVLGQKDLLIRTNEDEYADTGATDYTIIETIPYIDVNWEYGYFDIVHGYLRMQEIYEAKGVDDNARWAASSDEEREILVRWNLVGLGKANDILDPDWSEIRKFKEVARKYREFEFNVDIGLTKRFNDYYRYLNTILSSAGRTKFSSDWVWSLKNDYIENYLREFELGEINGLIDWHDTVLSTYTNADFTGTIPNTTIVSGLRKVLANKKYFI
jgi:hypothetical protein